MIKDVRDEKNDGGAESRDHAAAVGGDAATTDEEIADNEKNPARCVQERIEMRKGKDEILEARHGRLLAIFPVLLKPHGPPLYPLSSVHRNRCRALPVSLRRRVARPRQRLRGAHPDHYRPLRT